MKRSYVKSLKEYEEPIEFDEKKILEAMRRTPKGQKQPTSIALEKTTVRELKAIAAKRGVPYQVLMRMFILAGLEKMKRAA